MPLSGVRGRMCFIREFRVHGEFRGHFAAGDVFAFDAEFGAVDGADGAVWEVQTDFGSGIVSEVVVVFEFVEIPGRCNDVV